MITVYVIESLFNQTWYTGIAIDAVARLKEYNSGKNRFTKGHRPWKIIYTEVQIDWMNARLREKYLKSAAGKNWLRKDGFPACVTQSGRDSRLQEKVKL